MTDARAVVLQRVRSALGDDVRVPTVARAYRVFGEHVAGAPALLDLLEERLLDYKATVHRCAEENLARTVAGVIDAAAPAGGLAVPAGVPREWVAGRDVLPIDATTAMLDTAVGAVTTCAVAVAETGTIVLDGSSGQGRRAVSLVPDLHVCVVRAGQVLQTVPEAVRMLDPCRPLTWISGPSATSDIELSRVEGVHGPRTLVVVLVTPAA